MQYTILLVTIQVDRLKTVREKHILKPCLVQEPDISAKVRQSCSSDPFSLQSKPLQPDYVSSYCYFKIVLTILNWRIL